MPGTYAERRMRVFHNGAAPREEFHIEENQNRNDSPDFTRQNI